MGYDVVIIGGGAAGLMAAGTAAERGFSALLVEKMEKPARKVRITGKGRCNLTNTKELPEFMEKVRSGSDFLRPALAGFDNRATMRFFESNGLNLIRERGDRVFPASGMARDVADTLERWARKMGADIMCFTRAVGIETFAGRVCGVEVEEKKGGRRNKIAAENVIIATGGVSYPSTGSTGDGYVFAHGLGHDIVEVRPSLVPLEADTRSMQGSELRNVNVTLLIDGKAAGSEFGEMEFFAGQVGGAVVLRLSRNAVDAVIDGRRIEISIDLKPALTPEKLKARIGREIESLPAGKAFGKGLLRRLVPAQLVAAVAKKAGVALNGPVVEVGRIVNVLKDFRMEIIDYRPFEEAVVTAGGVGLEQVDPETMQSKLVKGLYFAGEVLDVDADTGGYNLQIAFSTGRLAGMLKR